MRYRDLCAVRSAVIAVRSAVRSAVRAVRARPEATYAGRRDTEQVMPAVIAYIPVVRRRGQDYGQGLALRGDQRRCVGLRHRVGLELWLLLRGGVELGKEGHTTGARGVAARAA